MSTTKGHVALRRCRVCRQQRPKAELTRWVVVSGEIVADPAQTRPGRGIYTCSDACSGRLAKIKGLKR
jgi:predicted RNA-binding protein YlxR (DUF448 family)